MYMRSETLCMEPHAYNNTILTKVIKAFKINGWQLVENNNGIVTFVNSTNVCDEFIMTYYNDSIKVVVPMPNSNISYSTHFKNYLDACEYVIARMYDYMRALYYIKN